MTSQNNTVPQSIFFEAAVFFFSFSFDIANLAFLMYPIIFYFAEAGIYFGIKDEGIEVIFNSPVMVSL